MKTYRMCLVFAIAFGLSTRSSASEDWIGLYADPDATIQAITVLPFEPVTAYFVLHVPSFSQGVRAAEFMVEEWPEELGWEYGTIGFNWGETLQIGTVGEGISIAVIGDNIWVPDENGNAVIGTATFLSGSPYWPGDNIRLEIVGDPVCCDSPIIVDTEYTTHFLPGDFCWINLRMTPTVKSSFSSLKRIY